MLIFVSGILLLGNVKKREDESSYFEKVFSRCALLCDIKDGKGKD